MIEYRTREHQSINQCHRNADRNTSAQPPKRSARRRSMKINVFAHSRVHRRNHKRLSLRGKSQVAYESFIQNFINSFAVVNSAIRFAHHTCALCRSEILGHDSPQGEAWRGAKSLPVISQNRYVFTRRIYSRRHNGMNGELLPHAKTHTCHRLALTKNHHCFIAAPLCEKLFARRKLNEFSCTANYFCKTI